jgi:hypothetical protein
MNTKTSNAKFKIGDKVDFVNDYGIVFPDREISGVEIGNFGETRYFTKESDTPWYSSDEKHFHHIGKYVPECLDIKLNNGEIAKFTRFSDWGDKIFTIGKDEKSFAAILANNIMHSSEGDFEEAGFKLLNEFQPVGVSL